MKTWKFLTPLFVLLSFSAQAVNLQNFHFSNSPTFATLEDGLLKDGLITTDYTYIVVASYNYVKSPLIELDGSDRTDSIINYMHTMNIGGAYRFSDIFQLGISSFVTYEDVEGIDEDEHEKVYVMGDTTVDFKYKFYEKNRLSIAFTPKLYLATGDKKYFTSNGGTGYFLGFAIDKAFDLFQIALNFGHKSNPDAKYDVIDYRQQFHFSAGAIVPLMGKLDLTAEFFRDTPYDSNNEQIPSEANLGLRYANALDSALFGGVGTGSLEESNSSDLRVYFGYKYFPSPKRSEKIEREQKKFGTFYRLHNVYFATSSSKANKSEIQKLDKMVEHLKRDPFISKIVVEGYASRLGSIERNEELSTQRAKNIMDYVISKGIDKDLIHYISFGNSKSDKNDVDKDQDRKVAFRIYKSK